MEIPHKQTATGCTSQEALSNQQSRMNATAAQIATKTIEATQITLTKSTFSECYNYSVKQPKQTIQLLNSH